MDENLSQYINDAISGDELLTGTGENLRIWLGAERMPQWVGQSIAELIEKREWSELNDRFHKNLAFGTGGMRGRTIGKVVTGAERGKSDPETTPVHAAIGSNTLNDFTVVRATMALYQYVKSWMAGEGILDIPRIIIGHDVRHFSSHFCRLAASTWSDLGGYSMIFDGPRSTPQLSYSVRRRFTHAGIVITASHNPPHDNGFKAYFVDGAQVSPPHDKAIIDRYSKITLEETIPYVEALPQKTETSFNTLPSVDDVAYRSILEEAVLDADLLKAHCPKIVFTPIHGTGGVSAVPALRDHGVEVASVEEQSRQKPNFPTVESPNPENPEAFKMGISVAKKIKAKAVLATDPDSDRLGVAVLEDQGRYRCLTGNQIACLLAEYRINRLKNSGILPEGGSERAVILKTFVTTPMLEAIATRQGLRFVNTLTGFKWMAEKLAEYEETATSALLDNEGLAWDYEETDQQTRISVLLKYSNYVVLAAEESFGYLPIDLVRDKDANAAALAFSELLAYLNSIGSSPLEFLSNLYQKYGYYEERTVNLIFEGASGAEVIGSIIESYVQNLPASINGLQVGRAKNFGKPGHLDEDEKPLPIENFFTFDLENGYKVAIRASGTEPKIKYYFFGRAEVSQPSALSTARNEVDEALKSMAAWAKEDANERGGVSNSG